MFKLFCVMTSRPQKRAGVLTATGKAITAAAREIIIIIIIIIIIKLKIKLRGLSPQANYTDRATAACRRS
jgi:hypothetical protein